MAEILPGWVSISGNHPNSFSLLSPDLSSSGSPHFLPPPIAGDSGHPKACHRSSQDRLLPPSTPASLVFHDLAGKPRIDEELLRLQFADSRRFRPPPAPISSSKDERSLHTRRITSDVRIDRILLQYCCSVYESEP
ncbi:hypothetical protein RchiOBHm_Chr7g0187251 [Rosa chinensis]|uniref:Uncharacterized protein n=1 Tax=Rosa chinensis TaxID=74649 RepID=A0A2P6P462_ROSCH|nr:hypothetical protein RchiOBHm_Chr7g0187251 [Rosa chinensis]